jgi:hypothetical protein
MVSLVIDEPTPQSPSKRLSGRRWLELEQVENEDNGAVAGRE